MKRNAAFIAKFRKEEGVRITFTKLMVKAHAETCVPVHNVTQQSVKKLSMSRQTSDVSISIRANWRMRNILNGLFETRR